MSTKLARPFAAFNPYRVRRYAHTARDVSLVILTVVLLVLAFIAIASLSGCSSFVDVCGTLANGGYLHADSVDANGNPASFMLFSRSGDLLASGVPVSAVIQCR